MPNTRKKVIKTVYKDDDDSEFEEAFSDSGSEAKISEVSSSDDEVEAQDASSGDDFKNTKKSMGRKSVRKSKFAKSFINKINNQTFAGDDDVDIAKPPPLFSVKDLTEEDKLLPSILNLSESDSSDDEYQKPVPKAITTAATILSRKESADSEKSERAEYKDVWSNNVQNESEEIARKAFMELERHKSLMEETKASIDKYTQKEKTGHELNVNDLLAQGEEFTPQKTTPVKKISRSKKQKYNSESETEDWEEVKESKAIPQQGLQLIVEFPNAVRKTKKVDVEMMMKRKMNRVKKEYQVYMHKVHVLCWFGHGNYVSKILNDQELLAAALTLVPSKECYPGERVDMKYLEQITTWYKDKFTLKQDKNENKYKPKAPPLKDILISQIKSRVVTTKKYLVYIFICMLRALGLQCRVMYNFITLPLKPPSSELCSLSTKPKEEKKSTEENSKKDTKCTGGKMTNKNKAPSKKSQPKDKINQIDGADDYSFERIAQLDGNDDQLPVQTRSTRSRKQKSTTISPLENDISPTKKSRKSPSPRLSKTTAETKIITQNTKTKNNELTNPNKNISKVKENIKITTAKTVEKNEIVSDEKNKIKDTVSPRKTRTATKNSEIVKNSKVRENQPTQVIKAGKKLEPPKIKVTNDSENLSSKYFNKDEDVRHSNKSRVSRKRSRTTTPIEDQDRDKKKETLKLPVKNRTKSAPGTAAETSQYFDKDTDRTPRQNKKPRLSLNKSKNDDEDQKRVSHRDLAKSKANKNNVKNDLVGLIKGRIKEAKDNAKVGIVKGKIKESDEDSDYLPEEDPKRRKSAESDEDFKPAKVTAKAPKPGTSKKIDRRVLSTSEEELPKNKVDVWCEVFVEELEQWISVDVVKAKVHCAENLYSNATHPVCYVVGWDNNNYLKDLTRRYVPHWNTVTRKQRAEPEWWNVAVQPWLGPKNARDREEDEQLDRMQLEAPLPKSIAEYKNHPLYALKRHLLKYEALYPPDAAVLGFVRSEPVYARECVYVCRSRDTWLKEAKVVRIGEQPYKVVKARPKWDKLSNKLITDKPLEIFGPWQVQDYEPPEAENGIVPRNAYGNVELFKDCMLPKGTVHIKLPGLNRVAKKLNIDCAPAMTGFDFNGGWSHPVYDGFVVCKEYEEIITEAWVKDQEEQERKEREKIDARVYGNWRRLIKGLFIRERLKLKYGFEEPSTSQDTKKSKGPRLVVKKK